MLTVRKNVISVQKQVKICNYQLKFGNNYKYLSARQSEKVKFNMVHPV